MAETYPPLESEDGLVSDHKSVFVGLRFPPVRDFKWIRSTVRLRSDRRTQAFKEELQVTDWTFMEPLQTDEAVAAFESTIKTMTDKHFPLTTYRKRSNEDPWITHRIRRKAKRKRRLFRKGGRSQKWRAVTKSLETDIRESKESFVDELIASGGEGKDFFAAVKKLSAPGAQSSWSVREIFPGIPDSEVCGEVLEYFSTVAGSGPGEQVPYGPELPVGISFTPGDVQELLENMKKKDSHVEGDPLPHLVRGMPALFATPVAMLFNKSCGTSSWPENWKTEHVTVIPKVKNPTSLAETRNISCTALLSKILEGALLRKLRSELFPDPDQYGGMRRCGAEHMLASVWHRALTALDSGEDAVVMLGVDFQKAFNRMEYAACINQLERLGASQATIGMVKSFLRGRKMTMKLGETQAGMVKINRGSPQGSVLGSMLYCATTQSLLEPTEVRGHIADHNRAVDRGPELPAPPVRADLDWDRPGPSAVPTERGRRPVFFPQHSDSEDSESSVVFWEEATNDQEDRFAENMTVELQSGEENLGAVKYIDDTTLIQKVPMSQAVRHCTTAITTEMLTLGGLAERFAGLVQNAEDIGMVINCAKTQLLCMSPQNGCQTSAVIDTKDGPVQSVDTLKLVGFVFGSTPDAAAHVDHIAEKFRIRVWLLHHLRESGIKEEKLFKLYNVYIRSVIEYCSPIYHPLLNRGQANRLEGLQRHAGRVCFGCRSPIRQVFADLGVETLEERRESRVDRFVRSTVAHPRFGHEWYQRRPQDRHGLRERRAFWEMQTRTSRLFNSPINYFVRRANFLGLG